MKPKTIKVTYWIATVLFALFMVFSGVSELMMTEEGKQIMIHLGYPIYMLYMLGIAKILGTIALLQTKYQVIKEWAYAGFAIDILSASISMFFVGDNVGLSLMPLIFLVVMFISYGFWKKMERLKTASV
ncbi:MAG: DoxX family protein [Candidatus Taylorbacteria bacterium]|nr:DoxX family protein [Candidatus Taylorbacteria bacterium]